MKKSRKRAPPREGGPYRLPSEAEWEYAARAGTTPARWWGDALGTGNANCNGCGSAWDNRLLTDVDSLAPNPFGLYGILGNAWQWTADCWHPSYIGAPSDGSAHETNDCRGRVLRGGAWDEPPAVLRSAERFWQGSGNRSSNVGLRVARTLPP